MSNTRPVERDKRGFRKDGACEQIYSYIDDYYKTHGFAPSYRQIAFDLGFVSKSSIHHHLMHLQADEFVVIHGSRGAIPKSVLVHE